MPVRSTLSGQAYRIDLDGLDFNFDNHLASGRETGLIRNVPVTELHHRTQKKRRFRLTQEQHDLLLNEFGQNAHPNAAARERLASEIPGLSPRQVQVWFQNQRAKLKRLQNGEYDQVSSPSSLSVRTPASIDHTQTTEPPRLYDYVENDVVAQGRIKDRTAASADDSRDSSSRESHADIAAYFGSAKFAEEMKYVLEAATRPLNPSLATPEAYQAAPAEAQSAFPGDQAVLLAFDNGLTASRLNAVADPRTHAQVDDNGNRNNSQSLYLPYRQDTGDQNLAVNPSRAQSMIHRARESDAVRLTAAGVLPRGSGQLLAQTGPLASVGREANSPTWPTHTPGGISLEYLQTNPPGAGYGTTHYIPESWLSVTQPQQQQQQQQYYVPYTSPYALGTRDDQEATSAAALLIGNSIGSDDATIPRSSNLAANNAYCPLHGTNAAVAGTDPHRRVRQGSRMDSWAG